MLQITFLEPYYRLNRERTISDTVNEAERIYQSNLDITQKDSNLRTLFAKQNMCGIIYSDTGIEVSLIAVDLMGQNCFLRGITSNSRQEYISLIQNAATGSISFPFTNEFFDQSMSFFGKEMAVGDSQFYIFVNTPMELLDSTVTILKNQFFVVIMIVIALATGLSIMLSRHLAYPLVTINNSAKKLASGDFNVEFTGEGYNEAIELSEILNYATSEFSKTDELRRDLVANVSHDIKTPLTMIKAYAEMIKDISGDDPLKREEHLDVIVNEVDHLERLVNDMLTLSKYESKAYVINETEFELLTHVKATLRLFFSLDINFIVNVREGIFVKADEIKMGQVLYNFINNATRFVGEDNTIIIEALVDKNLVTVRVIDHGIGISKEHQNTVWDRYAQINKHHRRNENSTGLGLSIVRAICEATGSSYGVISEEGEGATFYYTLNLTKMKSINKG
ncbi:sensor histidine kinase [Erysipelothrix larvae]|nr:HAMP domain-containing sensor histidine kinase [Erysipelothrix larvae]